jgi:hypothetical protein
MYLADKSALEQRRHSETLVLHYDKDFDAIAAVTGQTARWIVERGTGG